MKDLCKVLEFDAKNAWLKMNQRRVICILTLFVAASLVAGCHGDPNVRKQKYLESGKRYSAEGKYREASIQFSNALKVDKSFPDAHYELAQTYVHLGQFGAAYAEYMRTVDLQPTNYKARIDLGNLLLAGGKTENAQKQADAVIAAQPDNPDVHALLSAIALKQGKKDQALIEIRRAQELDPNRSAFHADLALLQASDPSNDSSVESELKKSVALDAKSQTAKLLLASFYMKNSRWQEAEQVCREAIAAGPKSLSPRAVLAQVFLRKGDQAKAEEVMRQASNDLADNPQGVRMLANYYTGSGQMDKSRAEFASLVAKYPKNSSVQKGYIRVLLQLKDYATARTVVAGLMKNSSKDPEVAALNGIVLLRDGKTDEAVNALTQGAKNFPKDAFIQFWLGKAATAKGDGALAEKSFRQVVELNPRALNALEELASIAGQRGDMALLTNVADKAIAAAPRFPGGYVWRAMVELSHSSQEKAEADLKMAMSVAPQSPQAYLQLGKLRFAQKRPSEGIPLLEQTLQFDPNSFEAMRILVAYNLSQKQMDKALARLNAQIVKSPQNGGFYNLLSQLEIQNKNWDKAAAAAQKAIQLNSADRDSVMLFAQIQTQRGKVGEAINAWEQWRDAHPNDADAIAVLGTLEESRGDYTKAVAYYKKSLQIHPKQPIAANNLAYRMLQNGENVDVALTLAQTARQAMPNSPSAEDTLAWAYYHKGTYTFARDLLEDAIKIEPANAMMQYHLGMVYSKLQDKSNATIHLKKAATLAPDSSAAKDARVALEGLG